MRIEGLERDTVAAMAKHVSYVSMRGMDTKIQKNHLRTDDGTRAVREKGKTADVLAQILKLLRLDVDGNKIAVLRLLDRPELFDIISRLDKSKLLNALRLFPKEKLLRLMMYLPKRMLIKMLLTTMNIDELVKRMPTQEMFRIFRSHKLPTSELVKGFAKLEKKHLVHLFRKLFGQDFSHLTQAEMLRVLGTIKKRQLMQAMKFLPGDALRTMTSFFAKNDPQLLENLSLRFLYKQFAMMDKAQLIGTFSVLPENVIVDRFMTQLPMASLVMAASQIDTNSLQAYLLSEQPGLLQSLAA